MNIKIPDKGYNNGKEGRGELMADVKIMNPKAPTSEELGIFKKLSEISKFNPRSNL